MYTKFEVSILNGCGDIFDEKSGKKNNKYREEQIWRESKKNKYRKEQIGEGPFSIPRYNLSLQTSIPNLKFLSKMVVQICLTKNLERKKKEQIQGRTSRRRSIFNPTIQHVIVNLYTKFEVSNFNGFGDIFDEKSGKKEKGTNTRKNK